MSNSELNVLLLAGCFEVRGSCTYTLRLAEYASQYQIRTRVVCPDATKVPAAKRAQVPITEYPFLNIPLLGCLVRPFVRRDLAEASLTLIHIQSLSMLNVGTYLARRLRLPFVLTVHDESSRLSGLKLDTTWRRRVIAVSEAVKVELLKQVAIPEDLVTVIHSGVECPTESAAQTVLQPDHVPVVGTAGPLESVKGIPFFLGAAQKVLSTRRDVEFLVSGAGPEESNLRRLARELGISPHVTFAPNFVDFSASLAAMDVFCLPSLRQGLGTIMLEAMVLGKPVIASGVGGVYSVVHDNETGLVVPPSDSDCLADRILELLDNRPRARAIGEKARQLVQEHFNVDEMVRRTTNVYADVMETQKTKGVSVHRPGSGSFFGG